MLHVLLRCCKHQGDTFLHRHDIRFLILLHLYVLFPRTNYQGTAASGIRVHFPLLPGFLRHGITRYSVSAIFDTMFRNSDDAIWQIQVNRIWQQQRTSLIEIHP